MNETINTVSPEAIRLALAALSRHRECFWTRRPDVQVSDQQDVELIIRRLRQYGGRDAWKTAREIERCL